MAWLGVVAQAPAAGAHAAQWQRQAASAVWPAVWLGLWPTTSGTAAAAVRVVVVP